MRSLKVTGTYLSLVGLTVTGLAPVMTLSYLFFGVPKNYLNLIKTAYENGNIPVDISPGRVERILEGLDREQLASINEIHVSRGNSKQTTHRLKRGKLEITI